MDDVEGSRGVWERVRDVFSNQQRSGVRRCLEGSWTERRNRLTESGKVDIIVRCSFLNTYSYVTQVDTAL